MRQAYATPTAEIIRQMLTHPNPVTRAVYREIVGGRIDRHELARMQGSKE